MTSIRILYPAGFSSMPSTAERRTKKKPLIGSLTRPRTPGRISRPMSWAPRERMRRLRLHSLTPPARHVAARHDELRAARDLSPELLAHLGRMLQVGVDHAEHVRPRELPAAHDGAAEPDLVRPPQHAQRRVPARAARGPFATSRPGCRRRRRSARTPPAARGRAWRSPPAGRPRSCRPRCASGRRARARTIGARHERRDHERSLGLVFETVGCRRPRPVILRCVSVILEGDHPAGQRPLVPRAPSDRAGRRHADGGRTQCDQGEEGEMATVTFKGSSRSTSPASFPPRARRSPTSGS